MENYTQESDSLVTEIKKLFFLFLSSMEHVEFRMNLRRPLRKTKYSWISDSEIVPWGNGEKEPREGIEKEREIASLQSEVTVF